MKSILTLVMCWVVILAAVLVPVGCAGTAEERQKVFDDSIRQAEADKAAVQGQVNQRIAEAKAAFDQQRAALEKEIAKLEADRAGAATPQAVEKIDGELAAVKAIEEKVQKVFDSTVGKFEKLSAEISSKADAAIASLKAERERITSEDPGQQISGTGKVIGDAVGGKEGLLVTLISGAIGSLVTGIWKQKQLAAEKQKAQQQRQAALEAVGTMSQAIDSGLMPMSDEAAFALKQAQSKAARDFVDEADKEYGDTRTIAKAAAAMKLHVLIEEAKAAAKPGAVQEAA